MLLEKKYSYRQIAKAAIIHHTSISREIKRNSCIYKGENIYDPVKAESKIKDRMKKLKGFKLTKNSKLVKFIYLMLKGTWSPYVISVYLKKYKSKSGNTNR